jgi:hypothetical protein
MRYALRSNIALVLLLMGGSAAGDTRTTSVSMTPVSSNPGPASRGVLYTRSSDGRPVLVDTAAIEYPAGESRHIYSYAGAPPGAVLGDCWTDSTDSYRLWCKEGVGVLPQRVSTESFFSRTCTLTSAAATTPVNCLTDAEVPAGKRAYLLGWHAKVNGATPWATTATCWIRDTAGTSNNFITLAVAALTGNAFIADHSANVTQNSPYAIETGGTADLGIEVACDANGTGSNLVVTVYGVIK